MDHLITRNSHPLRLGGKGVHWKVQEVLIEGSRHCDRAPQGLDSHHPSLGAQEITCYHSSSRCPSFLLSLCRWAVFAPFTNIPPNMAALAQLPMIQAAAEPSLCQGP